MSDLLSGLGGALGGVTSLLSGGALFDTLGSVLHLPPVITNAAKTVLGAMTGNVMLAADGAMGVAQELSKNPPAATEYMASKDAQQAGDGYARSASVHEATPARSSVHEDTPVTTGGAGGGGPVSRSSHLDPKMNDYFDSLRTLEQNFTTLDGMDGRLNGTLSREDLQRASHDTRVSPELRKAAQFLLDNPGYFERLETSATGSSAPLDRLDDNQFTLNNVKNELHNVRADFAQYGRPGESTRPSTSAPPSSSHSASPPSRGSTSPGSCAGGAVDSSMKDIINDPSLSLEEKIDTILTNLTGKMDDEILQTMDDLSAAQDRKAGLTNDKGDDKALTQAQNDIDRLSLRLQQLVEKRKTMFEMMSTMSMKFDEMAKTAISNMRSA